MLKRLALLGALLLAGTATAQAQTLPADTINSSSVIATGNTFQSVLVAKVRRSVTVENNNASDNCWLFVGNGSPTKATSILLLPGGSYVRYYPYVPSDALQATCATTSDTLYVDYQ